MYNPSGRKLHAIAVISAVALAAAGGAFFAGGTSVQKAYSLTAAGEPTIKVTGDASTTLAPDQATLIVNVQTTSVDAASVFEEQEEKINEIRKALLATGNNEFGLTVTQRSVYPYYFFASVTVSTNADELSGLASSIRAAGFGLQTLDDSSNLPAIDSANKTGDENPILLQVWFHIGPATLTEALEEYKQEYGDLLAVLERHSLHEDRILQNNFDIHPLHVGYSPESYGDYAQVMVTVPLFNIGRMTDALEPVDGVTIKDVYLTVSDEAVDDARVELTRQAIDKAEDRAEETAESLDFRVKSITSIQVEPAPSYDGEIFYRGVKLIQPHPYQNITGEVSVSVTAEFALEKDDDE